jgi:hypothetical protein
MRKERADRYGSNSVIAPEPPGRRLNAKAARRWIVHFQKLQWEIVL